MTRLLPFVLVLLAGCPSSPEADAGNDAPSIPEVDAPGADVPGADVPGADVPALDAPAEPADAPIDTSAPGPRVTSFTDSGPIEATAGATYEGLRITSPDGPCLTIDVPNVRVADVELGPCGGSAAIVVTAGASDVVIEHVAIHESNRGVLADHAGRIEVLSSTFVDIVGAAPEGSAIEFDYLEAGGTMIGNRLRGSYGSDVLSTFQSSFVRIERNDIDVTITEGSAAAFTLGDSVAPALPGHDNYAGYNVVFNVGGVPPGIFGSTGNTILEHNCLRTGLQARTYPPEAPAPFEGVTIRFNQIGPGSFTPAMDLVAEWDTNVFGDGSAATCADL